LSESVYKLRDALRASEYRVGEVEEERSFLAESLERVVWSTVFETPQELLESWQETQAAAIARTQALAPEKSWELYLLLGTELEPSEAEEAVLNGVRSDTSYARKVLVLGLEAAVIRIEPYLAPLMPLVVAPPSESRDALSQLQEVVTTEGSAAERAVLEAFGSNRPLFGDL
jgi:hypothetical protein